MPTLQIRDLPEHLHHALVEKAKRHRRSLAQQAIVEMEHVAEAEMPRRRLQVVRDLRERLATQGGRSTRMDPVDAVREDRDR
jgi:plasmid stability protein